MCRAYVSYHCHWKVVASFCEFALKGQYTQCMWTLHRGDPTALPVCFCKAMNGCKLASKHIAVFLKPGTETWLWQHMETGFMQPRGSWFKATAFEMDTLRTNNVGDARKPWMVTKILKPIKQWLRHGKQEQPRKPLDAIGEAANRNPWVATIIHSQTTANGKKISSPRCHLARSGFGMDQVPIRLIVESASVGRKVPSSRVEPEIWDILLW